MTDFYTQMAEVARQLLAPTGGGGLGQGIIKLVRYTAGASPANAWDAPSTPTRTETALDGAARGVSQRFIGMEIAPGNNIVASDLQIIVAPWGGTYEAGDVLELDGKPVTILRVDNIPAVGTVSAIRFIVRG